MAPVVYLVRHAESAHNVSKDFSHRDPPLTELGQVQASGLSQSFPGAASVGVIVTSPLTRTLETTLTAFGHLLAKDDAPRLIIDPNLQERSDLPCDTGSDQALLESKFPSLDFTALGDQWFVKEGPYTPDDAAVEARAKAVRERIYSIVEGGEGDVVVVTHGVFMKFLSQDQSIDLPKAGWKAYAAVKGEDGEVILAPVA